MKNFKIITIVLFSLAISFYSCKDDAKTATQETSKSAEVANPEATAKTNTLNALTPEPAQNEGGVWHYTCSKGCAGGAGSAIKCNNCGGTLGHNTAYHSKTDTKVAPTSSAPFASPVAAPAAKTEPSQNAAGVWHYTCEKGCAGGAGATGSCTTCGGTLAHNKAYH